MQSLSLYIHIPFCVKKCDYCDFLSAPASEEVKERYMQALFSEIKSRGKRFANCRTETVFIGGGTPNVIAPEKIRELLEHVREAFHVCGDAEITMELNPGAAGGTEAFRQYKEAGINRLSIGLQSAKDEELRLLGRIHTFSQFEKTWSEAREAGFTNLNADLIYALPGQTVESWRQTLETVCAAGPAHISASGLILEEGTPFFERYASLTKAEEEKREERDRQMYALTERVLSEAGYARYEISNYAREGKACRHNLVYWNRGEYLGVGTGAASLINNTRFNNTSDLITYIQNHGIFPYQNIQSLSEQEQMEEFMFLGLRLIKGVEMERFRRLFHKEIESVYGAVLEKNYRDGLLKCEDGRIFLTSRGLDLSNYVSAQFLF